MMSSISTAEQPALNADLIRRLAALKTPNNALGGNLTAEQNAQRIAKLAAATTNTIAGFRLVEFVQIDAQPIFDEAATAVNAATSAAEAGKAVELSGAKADAHTVLAAQQMGVVDDDSALLEHQVGAQKKLFKLQIDAFVELFKDGVTADANGQIHQASEAKRVQQAADVEASGGLEEKANAIREARG